MKLVLTLALLLVLVAFGPWALACAGDLQAGQAAYDKGCKMCHGPRGQGNPAMAKALNVVIPDLGSKEVQAKNDDSLKKDIFEGKGKMKPVKNLSGTEVREVIAFVRTLAK